MDTATLPRLYLDDDGSSGGRSAPGPRPGAPKARRRIRSFSAFVTILLSLALAALLLWHRNLPSAGGISMALESFLPWLGLLSAVLLIPAVRSRSILAWASWLVPVIAWCLIFVPGVLPQPASAPASGNSLVVATQNLQANRSVLGTGSSLLAQNADLIAVQELPSGRLPDNLDAGYPYQAQGGSVALLSKFPILESQSLQLEGLSWVRALHATVQTPGGNISVYVVHAASVRPGEYAGRDAMLADLQQRMGQDPAERTLALGDFNAASTDRVLAGFQQGMTENLASDGGFGFTWPAQFPATRPDHIFSKGMTVNRAAVLAPAGSDHLGLINTLSW